MLCIDLSTLYLSVLRFLVIIRGTILPKLVGGVLMGRIGGLQTILGKRSFVIDIVMFSTSLLLI